MRNIAVSRRRLLVLATKVPAALVLSSCAGHAVQTSGTAVSSGESSTLPSTTSALESTTSLAPASTASRSATISTTTVVATPTPAPTIAPTPTADPLPGIIASLNARFPGRGWDFALRPLLLQIDNAPDARPQNGLSAAYVVYETPAEGGITRFTALYVQDSAITVGDIRSARLVDVDLTQQWDGILLHVGASTPVADVLRRAGLSQLDLDLPSSRPAFWRTNTREAPYNLYTSLERPRALIKARGNNLRAVKPRAFPTGDLPGDLPKTPASTFTIPYDDPSTAGYQWDSTSYGYRRYVEGRPLIDANTGRTVLVNNVVVQLAKETATNIIEDEEGSHSVKLELHGTGRALLLRDGQRFALSWQRQEDAALTAFSFADGRPAAFAPGNVWISLMPDTTPLE